MGKTILIPIDFEVESLNTAKLLLSEAKEPVKILLVYSEYLSDSIPELMFYSPVKRIDAMMTHEFREALAILRNRFSEKLLGIEVMLFHGTNRSAFRNFIESNNVDEVHLPKTYSLRKKKNSIDISPYVAQTKVSVHEHDWMSHPSSGVQSQLHLLFNT